MEKPQVKKRIERGVIVAVCLLAVFAVAQISIPRFKRSRTNAIMLQLAAERREHMTDMVISLMLCKRRLERFPQNTEEWLRTDRAAADLLFRPKGARRAYEVDFDQLNRGEKCLVIVDPGIDLGSGELPTWAYWEWWPHFRIHMRLDPENSSMPFYPTPDYYLEGLGIETPPTNLVHR